jgi:hypothetical protein
MRGAWEAALSSGHNEIYLGGDIGTWMVRFENADRTMIAYKTSKDPISPKTVEFRAQSPSRPECQLEGVQYKHHATHPGKRDYTVTGEAETNSWLRSAGLKPGDTIHYAVGYEWDAVEPACVTPPLSVLFHFQGLPEESPADAVTFTSVGGGRVFSAGSNMFANMLDSYNDAYGQAADPRIQMFMRALLDDFTTR